MKTFKFLLLFLCLPLQIFAQKEIDVYLIGGQSNATGQGYMRNIPTSYKIDTSVHFYYSRYLNSGQGADTWCGLCQASESKDKFGIEIGFGTALKKHFPQREIALIKHGLSGSNLYAQWNPGNRPNEKQGTEYAKFIATVKAGLTKLKEQGYTPIIRAMVWQQGEGDARDVAGMENSRRYGENLRNLILEVRKELSAPEMLFIYGKVMPMKAVRFPGRELVRQALENVAEGTCTELSVKNAFMIECDDLQMRRTDYHTPYPQDDVHLGTFGQLELGERFAKVVHDNY